LGGYGRDKGRNGPGEGTEPIQRIHIALTRAEPIRTGGERREDETGTAEKGIGRKKDRKLAEKIMYYIRSTVKATKGCAIHPELAGLDQLL
jgi:hypothetical protein